MSGQSMTEYVRTQGGRMIHRATCPWIATREIGAIPWNWAQGRTVDQIRQEMRDLGLEARFCRHCIGRAR